MRTWFGTDGIRGRSNELLTGEFVFHLGQAAGSFFHKKQKNPMIVIGRDTRLSSSMIEHALAAGLMSVGVNVVSLGVIPTPGVAYETKINKYTAGVVISASHNPFEDNGIKFFHQTGYKLNDQEEEEIEAYLKCPETIHLASPENVGQMVLPRSGQDDYITYLKKSKLYQFEGLHVVVDSANGAASQYAETLLRELGATVTAIHQQPNGTNINDQCGSTHLASLQETVKTKKADVGIALDGDADRLMVVDEMGNVVDGDDLLYIFAMQMKKEKTLFENTVVVTVMSNYGFIKALEVAGIDVKLTAVGDRYVIEEMKQGSYNLGGESSGHLIFGDKNTTGDGLMAGLELIHALVQSQKPLSMLTHGYQKSAQVMNNVKVKNKKNWEQNDAIIRAIEKANQLLAGKGRILVRASGTEELIRVMAEGPNQDELNHIVDQLSQVVLEHCS